MPTTTRAVATKLLLSGSVLWITTVSQYAKAQPKATGVKPVPSSQRPPPRTRRDFAVAMSHVKEGMPEKEVIALLGRPDDVRTQYDPDGIPTTNTREVWGYGTNGHLTFPTLGSVYIDTHGRAQYFYGGDPPGPETFREEEL